MSNQQASPESRKRPWLRSLSVLSMGLLLTGGAVAGTVYGPRVLARASQGADPNVAVAVTFSPIVVDVRNAEGELHHVKVGLAAELRDGIGELEFRNYMPRGREAAIEYLRTRDYETLTDAKRFDTVKRELSESVSSAMGKGRVNRVLVTDFVTQ
ncbi:MAG TPA: flagellar basal body-associated FliL family protein [Polyangiaceae bacterium]|nr:flagellar basal body-associated FliL family protein [Polyangiaceae bacterium]